MSPEGGKRQFPKHCVVLCVVTMEKVLINVTDKTCERKNLWNHCGVQGACWNCFESVYKKNHEMNNNIKNPTSLHYMIKLDNKITINVYIIISNKSLRTAVTAFYDAHANIHRPAIYSSVCLLVHHILYLRN
jgi:hypothetical protein